MYKYTYVLSICMYCVVPSLGAIHAEDCSRRDSCKWVTVILSVSFHHQLTHHQLTHSEMEKGVEGTLGSKALNELQRLDCISAGPGHVRGLMLFRIFCSGSIY